VDGRLVVEAERVLQVLAVASAADPVGLPERLGMGRAEGVEQGADARIGRGLRPSRGAPPRVCACARTRRWFSYRFLTGSRGTLPLVQGRSAPTPVALCP
jgi:hypothetical protein